MDTKEYWERETLRREAYEEARGQGHSELRAKGYADEVTGGANVLASETNVHAVHEYRRGVWSAG